MSSTPTILTYEQLMTSFQESREEIRRSREEFREKWEKSEKDWENSRKEWDEIKKQMKETDRKIERMFEANARLGDRLGQLVAAMVEGGVKRMFEEAGYEFDVCNPRYYFGNKKIGFGEVDLLLENGDVALLVEVKTNLSVDDVRDHQDKMAKFRLWADTRNDKRQFIAAVSGGVVRENVRAFALKQGMFVVQQSSENVEIISPEGKPNIW